MVFQTGWTRTAQAVSGVRKRLTCAVAARGFVANTVKGGGAGVGAVAQIGHSGTIGHIRAGGAIVGADAGFVTFVVIGPTTAVFAAQSHGAAIGGVRADVAKDCAAKGHVVTFAVRRILAGIVTQLAAQVCGHQREEAFEGFW